MATPDGKVTFEAEGRTHTLQLTTNAVCLLEDKVEKTTLEIATELQFNPRLSTIRALFWASLGDTTRTMASIGELIDEIGKQKAIALAREAFSAGFPTDDAEVGGTAPNPRTAAAG